MHERLAWLAAALRVGAASGPALEGAAAHIVGDAAVAFADGALALEDLLGLAARGGAKLTRRSSFCARS
jgi:hypothetical protein